MQLCVPLAPLPYAHATAANNFHSKQCQLKTANDECDLYAQLPTITTTIVEKKEQQRASLLVATK